MATVLEPCTQPAPGPHWRLSPELAAVWPGGWPVAEWIAAGLARIVKKGPQRTVLRVDLPGLSVYLKHHHLPDRVTRLRQAFRSPKAKREFDRLTELRRRGVPAPEPLGWGVWPQWPRESVIVTRALDNVTSLNRILTAGELTAEARQALSTALGRFLAKLHAAGVDHRDLHAGNIVVRSMLASTDDGFAPATPLAPGTPGERGGAEGGRPTQNPSAPAPELFLIDLDAVRLGSPLDRERSLANLALFGAGCFQATYRPDRLRFLHAYSGERGWLDPKHDVRGARQLFELARSIESATWTYNLTFWRHRDRRCLVGNRYYQKVRQSPCTGMAIRGVDDDWLARLARDPDALLRQPGVKILKHSKTSTVAEIEALIDGVPRRAILKKIGVTRWTDPWAAFVRPTSILRSWISGQGFLERNLPTPRPLVMLHRYRNGFAHDGYLVTEKLDDVQELDAYIAGLRQLAAAEARRRLRRQIDRVARAVQAMHRRHISHRDLKAANLLVTSIAHEETPAGVPRPIWSSPFPVAVTTLWFIDLVGVTRHKRLGKRRRTQNLARLNASFLTSPMITRSDRLRFLRIYLAWGVHGQADWKSWWRAIAAATSAKVERNKKSGRILG